jgi:hypothetical protein
MALIRKRDRRPVGSLTIVRASHWAFGDDARQRHGAPKWTNQPLIIVTHVKADEVCFLALPIDGWLAKFSILSILQSLVRGFRLYQAVVRCSERLIPLHSERMHAY